MFLPPEISGHLNRKTTVENNKLSNKVTCMNRSFILYQTRGTVVNRVCNFKPKVPHFGLNRKYLFYKIKYIFLSLWVEQC